MNAVEETRDGWARFSVEVRVPIWQAPALADAMTGNDDDVILAAEQAMRARVEDAVLEAADDLPGFTVHEVSDRLELAPIKEEIVKSFLADAMGLR